MKAVKQSDGRWMLMDLKETVNLGPGASTYSTKDDAIHAIQCHIAIDPSRHNHERFWALMDITKRR